MLLRHWTRAAASRVRCTAGRSRPISTAMMAITTSSSMRVKPRRRGRRGEQWPVMVRDAPQRGRAGRFRGPAVRGRAHRSMRRARRYNSAMSPSPPPSDRRFATTRWSLVAAAGRPDEPHAAAALADLCRLYWYPLYAYVRRRGHDAPDAEDLTQAFFARLLEKGAL